MLSLVEKYHRKPTLKRRINPGIKVVLLEENKKKIIKVLFVFINKIILKKQTNLASRVQAIHWLFDDVTKPQEAPAKTK